MKNSILILAAISALNINASSFIGIDADSIRINPNRLTGYWQVQVVANFEGYADTWQVSVTYPGAVLPKLVAGITALEGMSVPYTDQTGASQYYDAPLQVSAAYSTVSSTTAGMYGYWDYNFDGYYETYGNVKWEPGCHPMWEFNLYIPEDFRCGYIIFDGTINSGYDARGAILSNVKSYKRTWLWVGYERGDVSGNGMVDIGDVPLLIDYLLTGTGLDEFQIAAADVDGDGEVSISDVSALTDLMMQK